MSAALRFPISPEPPTSSVDRLRIAFDLYDIAMDLKRESLRRTLPAPTDSELDALLVTWLLDRPPDGEGVVVPWPRR